MRPKGSATPDYAKGKFIQVEVQERIIFKVAGHPARSAARLRIENEWVICHVDLSLPLKSMAEIAPQIKRQRSGTSLTLLWQLLDNMLFARTYGYWQQMKTTEDLEGLEFS